MKKKAIVVKFLSLYFSLGTGEGNQHIEQSNYLKII